MDLEYYQFVVYNEPYCIWDVDLGQINLEFINSMEPEYFKNVVVHNSKQLEGEERNLAAISIRLAYFHSLETFFSLICAALQAPRCVVGWLQKYPPGSLQKMVKDIDNGKSIMAVNKSQAVSWNDLSTSILNNLVLEDKDKEKEIKVKFGKLWGKLATEFTNETLTSEYNNLKHGFRIRSGGFHMSVAEEKDIGVSPPPEQFIPMGGNEFGTSFFMKENICQKEVPYGNRHFKLKEHYVNWDPTTIGIRVLLLSQSIKNVLSSLKIINGIEAEDVQFHWPSDLSTFEKAFKPLSCPTHFSCGPNIGQEDIDIFTKEEIFVACNQT
ncbi:hypothetical protein [uncultured Methanolobus sp.]|uniref:hypothetical protein n=1 Tax=uncultured Methanolobus sp. TaxID=218300 RepID=UPI0029C67192|nr:hypothetical protein [uncultured Methanolobus sp.]